MSAPAGLSAGSNPSWSLTIWNKVHRYRCLLTKYWWVLLLTLSIALCVTAYFQMNKPPTFASSAKLSVNLDRPSVADVGTAPTQDPETIMATQQTIIETVADVGQTRSDILTAKYPGMRSAPVSLGFSAKNSIQTITATGTDPRYTERYLQATLESYLAYRKKMRGEAEDPFFKTMREQIAGLDEKLKQDNEALIQFQRDAGKVFDDADKTNENLNVLRQKRDTLQADLDRLKLMTPEQGVDRDNAGAGTRSMNSNGASSSNTQLALDLDNTQADYRQALALIADLQPKFDLYYKDMTDKHPKIIELRTAIETQQRRVKAALETSRQRIENLRRFNESQLADLDAKIKAAEPQALNDRVQRATYDQLVETKKRDQAAQEKLMASLAQSNLQRKTTPETIYVMENASEATAVLAPWAKAITMALIMGLAAGVGILFLIDRMDDRMGTISDFQMHFSEHVLGQIPRDNSGDSLEMLRPDDQRHQLVESYRNLRSTLLFMPMEGARPKTLLVTSAVPNEGKSTTSCNLALVLAFAGMKTLLIDADLRRGQIHDSFGVARDPGLTDVLGHNVNWKLAIRTTGIENLHVLPRGRNVPQPSEYLLNKATDRLLQELYPLYDYIIIDSSPVLAADDTASLAPKIDATLFVTRMGFTSAKMTRKSLEILYKRQANIPGVILNQVDTSSPEFVYYQYEEYYHAATDEDDESAKNVKKTRKVRSPEKVS